MRLKFAKKKRRQVLARGAEIIREEKYKAPSGKRKDGYFAVEVKYKGLSIHSADWDELLVYSVVLECLDVLDERLGEDYETNE